MSCTAAIVWTDAVASLSCEWPASPRAIAPADMTAISATAMNDPVATSVVEEHVLWIMMIPLGPLPRPQGGWGAISRKSRDGMNARNQPLAAVALQRGAPCCTRGINGAAKRGARRSGSWLPS